MGLPTLSDKIVSLELAKQLAEKGITEPTFMWWCANPKKEDTFLISPSQELDRVAPAFDAYELAALLPAQKEGVGWLKIEKLTDWEWEVKYIDLAHQVNAATSDRKLADALAKMVLKVGTNSANR